MNCTICKKKATRLVAVAYGASIAFEYEPRCDKHDYEWEEKRGNEN